MVAALGDRLGTLLRDEEGLTSVEYALLLAVLVIVSLSVWTAFDRELIRTVRHARRAFRQVERTRPGW
jgi:Flp pilus assembly pilin Flp